MEISCSSCISNNNNKLPEELLVLIFEYCQNINKVLLNSRLTCKTWKFAIENSPQIMKQLTFNLYGDWPTFLQSTTLLTKIKSLVINQPLNGKMGDWFKICHVICKSIQIVKFDFSTVDPSDPQNIQQCVQMIQILMNSAATGLKELHIYGADIFLLTTNDSQFITHNNNIEILAVQLTEPRTLKKLIPSFPKLKKIVITRKDKEEQKAQVYSGRNSADKPQNLHNVLREYITNCQHDKYLQEIVINEPDHYCFMGEGFLAFILYCAKHGIKVTRIVNRKEEIRFNLNKLFSYYLRRMATEQQILVNHETCQYLQLTTLDIHGDDIPLPTSIIEYCTNIQDLKIRFYRPIELKELLFLSKLQKLTSLKLIGQLRNYCGIEAFDGLQNMEEKVDLENLAVVFPLQSLELKFNNLKNLEIKGDLFGRNPGNTFSLFYSYFPNLQSISMENLGIVPEEIFVHLLKLEFLKQIKINGQSGGQFSINGVYPSL